MTFRHEQRRPASAWVVVADRARARVFETEDELTLEEWNEVHDLAHATSELHERDTKTDGGGTFTDRAGGRHAGENVTDFRHHTAEEFAGKLTQCLEQGRMDHRFGRLVLVAAPLMLGVVRKKMPGPLAKLVVSEIDKELTQLRSHALQNRLRGLLPAKVS